MYIIGLALTLKPGAYEGYKKAHDELWPELAKGMRDNQVNMAIFRDGLRLFLFATAPDARSWDRSREDPILNDWNREMANYLETDGNGQLAIQPLPKAFGFGQFA
jgi:L-rhamnose mutarotase